MSTLNHLKKGESLANKQLVVVNSSGRDDTAQSTSSFTYTFDEPIKRVSKIDVIYSKIPKTFYNLNNDDSTMSITTETLTGIKTESLVVNDDEVKNDIIQATNLVDGTLVKTNISSGTGNIQHSVIKTNNTFIYTAGYYENDLVDFENFTGSTANMRLTNTGLTDLFISKYTLGQTLVWRCRIGGIVNDDQIDISVSDTDVYSTGIFRSAPITFYDNTDDISKDVNVVGDNGTLISDGNPTSFVTRYNNNGINQWRLKIFGVADNSFPTKIVFDSVNNFIYVAGTYNRDLKIFNTASSNTITDITSFTHNGDIINSTIFLAKFNLDGVIQWVTKISGVNDIGTCFITSIVLNPLNNNLILGASFSTEMQFYNAAAIPTISVGNNLSVDGSQNIAIIEYNTTGQFVSRTKIGGSVIENNIQLDAIGDTLIVAGRYNSNPLRFYTTNAITTQATLPLNGLYSNIFIAKYTINIITNTYDYKWSTNMYDETFTEYPISVSLSPQLDILICSNYSTLFKFNDINGYVIGKDLLNTSGNVFTLMAKYDTNGNFKQRSYITTTTSSAGLSVNARSNDVFISGMYSGTATLINSDESISKTLSNTTGSNNGFIISYVNNINNYTINTTTLTKRIVCRMLTGTNLNFKLNINAFSQQLGLTTTQNFQATNFGNAITWNALNITSSNNILTIVFSIGNKTTKIFDSITKNFTILNVSDPGYTPYSLAFELSSKIKSLLTNDTQIPFNQTDNAVVYDDIKKIFYLQLYINGTFTITGNNLTGVNGLNFTPGVVSHHCLITPNVVGVDSRVSVNDNSKLTIKLNENTVNTRFNNVAFSSAFPDISSKSGSLILNTTVDRKIQAVAGDTIDELKNDINVNDVISFDSPWLVSDKNENTFINRRQWTSVDMAIDDINRIAVATNDYIYISRNRGVTWSHKESKRSWIAVSVSLNFTFQTAAVSGGQIYTSTNSGNTWIPREFFRQWVDVDISRRSGTGSTEGQHQIAAVSNSFLYVSADTGVSWTTRASAKNWKSVAISQFGDIQMAVAFGDSIYKSTDYGVTWNAIVFTVNEWQCISITNNGTTQIAVTYNGAIYKSTDTGDTWVKVSTISEGNILTSVSISPGDSNIIIAVGSVGDIYRSINSGVVWTKLGYQESFSGVASSEDGLTHTISVKGGDIQFGQNKGDFFNDSIDNVNWTGVAMSSDGVIQVAIVGTVYISINSGNSWNVASGAVGGGGLAISSDGKYIICIIGDALYLSINTGGTFVNQVFTDAAGVRFGAGINAARRVGMSSTGQYITIPILGNKLYVSETFGTSLEWVLRSTVDNWQQVAVSSAGLIQIATTGTALYVTFDIWLTKTLTTAGAMSYCAISDTGKYMSAVSNSFIRVSNDFGASWANRDAIRDWQGINMSSSGQTQTAVSFDGNIYVSKDFGVTWVAKDIARKWKSCAVSSNGIIQTAVSSVGNIFRSTNTGDTWNKKLLTYTNVPSVLTISSISISGNNGQYISYTAHNDFIYVSNNFGKSFTRKNIQYTTYNKIKISADGQKQVALRTGGIDTSTDGGITWTQLVIAGNFTKISMTPAGNIVTILGPGTKILTSTNGGVFADEDATNATDNNPGTKTWSDITMSTDGSVKYASSVDDGVWKFTTVGGWSKIITDNAANIICRDNVVNDGNLVTVLIGNRLRYSTTGLVGANDAARFVAPLLRGPPVLVLVSSVYLTGITMGLNGKQTLTDRLFLYTTDDNWENFTRKWAALSYKDIDSTIDGTNQVSCALPGRIHQSFNSGDTWGIQQTERNPSTISISNDGDVQLVGSSGRELYESGNNGNTWTTIGISNNWRQVGVSRDDGSVQVAIPYTGKIYTSINTGLTWIQQSVSRNWRGITMSTDGTTLYAAAYGNHIYKSTGSIANWIATSDQGANPPGIQNWIDVAVSGDGTKIIAAIENGIMYRSINSGTSWFIVQDIDNVALGVKNWRSIAVSNDGAVHVGVIFGGQIFVSHNQINWDVKDSNRNWMDISVSNDGSVQSAVVYDGFIYVSTNFGASWVARGNIKLWVSISVNNNGTVQTAVIENGEIYKSIDSGTTWFIQTDIKEITSIEMSDTGVIQTVAESRGNIYFSSNSGSTWVETTESRNWRSIAMTSDGTSHTSVEYDGTIYRSTVANNTLVWTQIPGIGTNTPRKYTSISIDSTGLIRAAVVEAGKIYISVDNGGTYNEINVGPYNWVSVTVSEPVAGPTIMFAVARGLQIYKSIDTGTTWVPLTGTSLLNWQDISVSNDGTKVTAVVQGGKIYISGDSGVTWSSVESDRNWLKVDITDDGTKQIAIVNDGQIYSSTDTGLTWKASESVSDWRGICINGDGTLQMASTKSQVLSHPFDLNQRLALTVESVNPGVIDSFTATEITNGTNNGVANVQTLVLHDYNLADSKNFTSIRKEVSTTKDIFIPSANYTPTTLVAAINSQLASTNVAFTNAFTYNQSTGKISFTSPFSGAGLISSTNLLKRMGFTELSSDNILTAGVAIESNGIINTDISGPLNIFIKSDIIGNLRKNKTAFSTNTKLKNLIAPLDLDEVSNSYKIQFPVELFLSHKTDISSVDIQISDEDGNIVNLNNSVVQVNLYFYSS
jgi:hypothetical protein